MRLFVALLVINVVAETSNTSSKVLKWRQVLTNKTAIMDTLTSKRNYHSYRRKSYPTIEKHAVEVKASMGESGLHLITDLLEHYNRDVLPSANSDTPVQVRLLMKLTQLIDVDEKNQILTTSVWLRHEWFDHHLQWDPTEFQGIQNIHLSSKHIWLPDTVIYNK